MFGKANINLAVFCLLGEDRQWLPLVFSPMNQKYHCRIYVTLRPSVLDPAGAAVQSGLQHLGYGEVDQVRIGKYIELTLPAPDEGTARQTLDRICDQLLANTVIENYRFDLALL